MKRLFSIIIILLLSISCREVKKPSSLDRVNWEKRMAKLNPLDSTEKGSTFLSIYSQIYLRTINDQAQLTTTVSIHNPNLDHQIYIDKAVYYNTAGEPIRTYFEETIYINPMETVQIIIDGIDNQGGTGANFVFDWQIKPGINEPIMEAIMISTYSSQGISFVTSGKKIK
jgi:hypothetical protein